MPDMSLSDMLNYLLEYSNEGMSLSEIIAELHIKFGWNEPESTLKHKLESDSSFFCTDDKWKMKSG